jgi:hypothetical protein
MKTQPAKGEYTRVCGCVKMRAYVSNAYVRAYVSSFFDPNGLPSPGGRECVCVCVCVCVCEMCMCVCVCV